eukprot:jgi/Chlat1/7262/Chrsp58S06905
MFWRVAGLAPNSPVETVLDRGNYTLEDLLDEDDLIQECKSQNGRLIAFLRARPQVEALLRYLVEQPEDESDQKRKFKYPFLACEVFTCEIDVIFTTLLEDEELMNLLFGFLRRPAPLSALLAGYVGKVITCLLAKRPHDVMTYLRSHMNVLQQLVDHVQTTSITEVIVRLVGADEHMLRNHSEAAQWLADTDFLDMIMDKLETQNSEDVHANAAEVLAAIARTTPSALAIKLASPTYMGKLFTMVMSPSSPGSLLIHGLTVCIALMDPKTASPTPSQASGRSGSALSDTGLRPTMPDVMDSILQQLPCVIERLRVDDDAEVQPTTYGKLQPPLGIHRLKIVQFASILLQTGSKVVAAELMQRGAIARMLELMLTYPFNNFLHHEVENIIMMILTSGNEALILHLLQDCDLIGKIIRTDGTLPTSDCWARAGDGTLRAGYMGHLSNIANKVVDAYNAVPAVKQLLSQNTEWQAFVAGPLHERNERNNVLKWSCGRPAVRSEPTPLDSDGDDDFRNQDFELSNMANNIISNRVIYQRYDMFDNDEADANGDGDDQDVYYAEVVMSSLHLGNDQAEDGANALRVKEVPASLQMHNTSSFEFDRQSAFDTSPTDRSGDAHTSYEDAASSRHADHASFDGEDDQVMVGDTEEVPAETAGDAIAGKAQHQGLSSPTAVEDKPNQEDSLFNDVNYWRRSYTIPDEELV